MNSPPIFEPILVVGLGCPVRERDFDPWPHTAITSRVGAFSIPSPYQFSESCEFEESLNFCGGGGWFRSFACGSPSRETALRLPYLEVVPFQHCFQRHQKQMGLSPSSGALSSALLFPVFPRRRVSQKKDNRHAKRHVLRSHHTARSAVTFPCSGWRVRPLNDQKK